MRMIPGMIDEAVHWASMEIGAPILRHERLTGGLTSTMLTLIDQAGTRMVLRLMTEEPWKTHGEGLTSRERAAQLELAGTTVPAPKSLSLDARGIAVGVAAHLMTHRPGTPDEAPDEPKLTAMAEMLARIHDVQPREPFRTYQSWAPPAKWVVPEWTKHPNAWRRAFAVLQEGPPEHEPVFIHRDFSHRNLLWRGTEISGVVDWVETSHGPAWLDAAHAATNLALALGVEGANSLLKAYGALTESRLEPYWLVLDAVGFLPVPGRSPLFVSEHQRAILDGWLYQVMTANYPTVNRSGLSHE